MVSVRLGNQNYEHYVDGQGKAKHVKSQIVFPHLPSFVLEQLCVLAHLDAPAKRVLSISL